MRKNAQNKQKNEAAAPNDAPVFISNLFTMNTNSAVTSPPVARGGLTADRMHNRGLDLPLAQPATYDTISPNEAEAWEQAGREAGLSVNKSMRFPFLCQEHKHAPNLNQLHSIQFIALKKMSCQDPQCSITTHRPLNHLNGTNPDRCKSSRVHAEKRGERGRAGLKFKLQNGLVQALKRPFSITEPIKDEVKIKKRNMGKAAGRRKTNTAIVYYSLIDRSFAVSPWLPTHTRLWLAQGQPSRQRMEEVKVDVEFRTYTRAPHNIPCLSPRRLHLCARLWSGHGSGCRCGIWEMLELSDTPPKAGTTADNMRMDKRKERNTHAQSSRKSAHRIQEAIADFSNLLQNYSAFSSSPLVYAGSQTRQQIKRTSQFTAGVRLLAPGAKRFRDDKGYVLYPQIGDRLDLICPPLDTARSTPEYEFYKLYLVSSREQADRCEVTGAPNIVLTCDEPTRERRFTIKFQEFSPNLWGHEFKSMHDYYIIGNTSRKRHTRS
ncbi:Ephrin-B3 Precursor [Collichthys lucidus]|uniref:Ephrin-B3 n=1 Tax=Collichthys lucidus TaxID=240159 RepID=A0A4U5VV63_COLLU|nr:Ephrin-B3 Precursor [Collichthys lucidus]